MAVHPIEERYGTSEMRAVWSEKNRSPSIVTAEVALARGESATARCPCQHHSGFRYMTPLEP